MRFGTLLITVMLVLVPTTVLAYIGPGAGLGAVATLVAVILGLILLAIGFIWYPLKRLLKKRKMRDEDMQKVSRENDNR